MFCTECGTRNSADHKYCKECGHKVNDGYRNMMLSIEDTEAVESEKNQERLTKLLEMAFWHNQAGNMDAAILACEAALTIHPDSTTAHSLLGSLYEKKDDDVRAIEHFEAVVRLNPDSAADAAKLDQIRRGVHVKAVSPPPVYKWLPPAFMAIDWSAWRSKLGGDRLAAVSMPSWPDRYRRPLPIAAASAAGLCVLGIGLLAIRPSRPVNAAVRTASVSPPSGVLGNGAAYAGQASGASVLGSAVPPTAGQTPRNAAPYRITTVVPDPFGEVLPTGVKTTPLVQSKHGKPNFRTAALVHGFGAAPALPALSLRAIPLNQGAGGSGAVAPAPVTLPMTASVAAVPQHTVVVSSLGGPSYPAMQTSPSPQYSSYTAAPQSSLASHIKITINDSPSDNSISISDHGDPRPAAAHSSDVGGQDGDAYQQTAIALQQQGNFRGAKSAYQRAIKAYKSQIASGHDANAASQGLAASQTGLQICDQGQQ